MTPPRSRKTSLARFLERRNAPPPVPTTPAPEPGPPPAAGGASTIRIVRKSKMDAFAHLIGVRPDREVAELAGVTPENVRAWRKRRGIGAEWRGEDTPAAPAPPEPRAVPVAEPGPPPGAPPEATAVQIVTDLRGFLVTADDEEEFLVVAPDIARAASLAVSRLHGHRPSGRVVSVQYVAEMLGE